MTTTTIIFLFLGSAAGGFINGLAGFGTSLFALGFLLNIMPPIEAVAVTLVISVISGLQGLWIVRTTLIQNPIRLARFLIPALFGIPLGVMTLSTLNAFSLKIIIALFLIIYGGYFSMRSTLPQIERKTPVIDSIIGLLGGFLGGLASLSGALPTMWCAMRSWSKVETRAVLQPFNVTILFLTAVLLAWRGVYTVQILTYISVALPVAMIFAQIGIMVFKRLSNERFKRVLITMTFVAGLIILGQALI